VKGLQAWGLVVRFGQSVALDGVSFGAAAQRITGLVGPEGAGKTTAFNVACGLQLADAGTVDLNGSDITHESPARRGQLGLGWIHSQTETFPSVSVRDNVALAVESACASAGHGPGRGTVAADTDAPADCLPMADELLETVGLAPMASRLAAELSLPLRRRLELARVMARRPRILLLDDAMSALDGPQRTAFAQVLVDLVGEQGTGILMFERDLSLVFDLCDWIHVIAAGRTLLEGTAPQIRYSGSGRPQ
jgi:branched-chain amino acid transport system ATP-binding protein